MNVHTWEIFETNETEIILDILTLHLQSMGLPSLHFSIFKDLIISKEPTRHKQFLNYQYVISSW